MRNFFQDFDNEDELEFFIPQGEGEGVPLDRLVVDLFQNGLDAYNLKVLELSVDIASRSFFWKFKSVEKKLRIIMTIYKSLSFIMDEELTDEETE
tara:strand:+ start:189 stop:473 length:285 start_codon:yes stop_codon:yes gene_type:complete